MDHGRNARLEELAEQQKYYEKEQERTQNALQFVPAEEAYPAHPLEQADANNAIAGPASAVPGPELDIANHAHVSNEPADYHRDLHQEGHQLPGADIPIDPVLLAMPIPTANPPAGPASVAGPADTPAAAAPASRRRASTSSRRSRASSTAVLARPTARPAARPAGRPVGLPLVPHQPPGLMYTDAKGNQRWPCNRCNSSKSRKDEARRHLRERHYIEYYDPVPEPQGREQAAIDCP